MGNICEIFSNNNNKNNYKESIAIGTPVFDYDISNNNIEYQKAIPINYSIDNLTNTHQYNNPNNPNYPTYPNNPNYPNNLNNLNNPNYPNNPNIIIVNRHDPYYYDNTNSMFNGFLAGMLIEDILDD
jgi:hypothetical protein